MTWGEMLRVVAEMQHAGWRVARLDNVGQSNDLGHTRWEVVAYRQRNDSQRFANHVEWATLDRADWRAQLAEIDADQ